MGDRHRLSRRSTSRGRRDTQLGRHHCGARGLVRLSSAGHMRVGVVPAGLLFVALGLALASAPRRALLRSLLALLLTSGVFSFVPPREAWLEALFFGCWAAVAATAAVALFVRKLSVAAALLLSIDAGMWASLV